MITFLIWIFIIAFVSQAILAIAEWSHSRSLVKSKNSKNSKELLSPQEQDDQDPGEVDYKG